jgi:Putative polyhydroxyalkanoic acid system protein (PHA_gran_rgn)
VPQPLIISVPHSLGKHEAVRRIKVGLEIVKSKFGNVLSVQQEDWSGDTLQFRIAALGQTAIGTIEVYDDTARLEVALPWLLAKAADEIQRTIQRQGTLMLEKQ